MTALRRYRAWQREKETNEHGMADVADEMMFRIARQISDVPSERGLIDWTGTRVVSWDRHLSTRAKP